jgi:hypothetical protein
MTTRGILAEPFYRDMLARLVAPIAPLDAAALETVATLAGSAVAGGTSPAPLAKAIVAAGVVADRKTAQVIGLTATGILYNVTSLRGYQTSGRTRRVKVYDNAGCPECAEAADAMWPLGRALDEPLGHAGCCRSFSPVVESLQ